MIGHTLKVPSTPHQVSLEACALHDRHRVGVKAEPEPRPTPAAEFLFELLLSFPFSQIASMAFCSRGEINNGHFGMKQEINKGSDSTRLIMQEHPDHAYYHT